ncbi:hypothetical protein E2C01_046286 [Portunus trituberculatus]|uniref:Uncharacterized protein n=1 Tax=Portunus trituberculatus TaxID=210409 RepID=A0A5B7G4G4_PORTR|nr:hypothetical protein [Portunus trituberculatus]
MTRPPATSLFLPTLLPSSSKFSITARHLRLIDMGGKCIDEKTIQGIIDLHKAGISNKEINIQKGLDLHTVQELIKRFKAGGGKN